ncbi:MAG: hypothetical protein J7K77_03290 [Dehalococcoidales bacterium]|nr:hypothetical protein [Dehalococcoidales bacterium]
MKHELGIIIVGIVILVLLGCFCRGFFVNTNVHLALRVVVGVIGGGVLALVIIGIKRLVAGLKKGKSEGVEK